ncbi:MAG TPA: hypothetical protein VK190_02925 [Pseudoneobacillus sp.]|jgi:hypothetical protein|nr:hypothetical protein [Pseudoneobacillus sp.]
MKKRAKVSLSSELLKALLDYHYTSCGEKPLDGEIILVSYRPECEIIDIYLDEGCQVAEKAAIPNIGG